MKSYQESLKSAKQHIKTADHMLLVTFKVVQEPQLLLNVLEKVDRGFRDAIRSLHAYESYYKKSDIVADNFESQMTALTMRAPRYNISAQLRNTARKVHETITIHKNSPLEFARQKKYIICNDKLKTIIVSVDMLKSYIAQAKELITLIEGLQHGRNTR